MKKFFSLAIALCLGMAANAQDTSSWEKNQDVTSLIQWKAYEALDEDPANPVWKGFQYGGPGEWEFRPAEGAEPGLQTDDANNNKYFICWGVYNLPALDIYQEFEMPAGVYTVNVSGCYRDGQDDNTLALYKTGNPTENCFVYVQVGEDVYQNAMQYKFDASITTPVTPEGGFSANNWGNEKGYNYNGTTIYSPQSHCCADWFLENGKFANNKVQFAVPEKMIVRVGIRKPVAVPQDQIWWNHWTMTYNSEFNDDAKAMIAAQNFEKLYKKADDFILAVQKKYEALGMLLGDEIQDVTLEDGASLEEVNEAIAQINAIIAKNEAIFTKAQALDKNLDICEGIAKLTDYAGKAEFQAAIDASRNLLYSEEADTDLDAYIKQAEDLMQARMDYLLTQEDNAEGSKDFTHALSYPWWVNQENTGTHDASGYHYPQNVQDALNSCDDGADGNLELGEGKQSGNAVTFEAVASKAHWSVDPNAENTWVYDDKWNGWHGGMSAFIQKLKGYAGINSDWSNGANSTGAMWVYQNLTHLPDGYYSLEGNVWHNANAGDGAAGWEINNNYMFINDGEGNQLAKVLQETESRGYWDGWDPSMYTVLKTDFVEIKGGKARMGYSSNTWMLISITELKYYGSTLDYTAMIKNKLAEVALQEGELWSGDAQTYNDMLAKVTLPCPDDVAYKAALAQINAALDFKKMAAGITNNFNVADQYLNLQNGYEEGPQSLILDAAWASVFGLEEKEGASYKDAQEATAIYNAYASYLNQYDRSIEWIEYNKKIADTQAEQVADLKANYGSVEKLNAYESALAGLVNVAAFIKEGADKASEANPLDVTNLFLVNADLSQGPKTGWLCEGADVNPSVNTYGRELAECWNQKPFKISQTLRSLPAGAYRFSVRACYRDAGSVDANMIARMADGQDYAYIYGITNGIEVSEPIKPVTEAKWETPSFDKWYSAKNLAEEEEFKALGYMADWDKQVFLYPSEYEDVCTKLNADYTISIEEMNNTDNSYPFDTMVDGGYYPSSMAGFQQRCALNPEAYCNVITVMVEEGGNLELGLNKVKSEGSDWLIYDDFKLEYLGTATPTGIKNVNTVENNVIFNIAGQRVNSLQKGINIVNGKKIYVK